MEKRKFSRVQFRTTATLTDVDGNELLTGDAQNMSLKGMLLTGSAQLLPQTPVQVKIQLEGGSDSDSLEISGIVLRTTNTDVAIQFVMDGVSLSTITHLRKIISYNLGDDDAVLEEILNSARNPVS